MAFKIVREEADHFVAAGAQGEFRIAKSGLKPERLEMFRGGLVPMAEGGEVPFKLSQPEPTFGDTAAAAGLNAIHGLTFHTLPVLAGAADAATGGNYDSGRAAMQQRLEETQEQSPVASLAGDVVGGVAQGFLLPVGTAMQAASWGKRLVQAAKVGGAFGAAYGAGDALSAGQDAAQVTQSAAIGAGVGAVAGPLFDGALMGAGKVWDTVAEKVADVPFVQRAIMSGDQRTVFDAFRETAVRAGMPEKEARDNAATYSRALVGFAKGSGDTATDLAKRNPISITGPDGYTAKMFHVDPVAVQETKEELGARLGAAAWNALADDGGTNTLRLAQTRDWQEWLQTFKSNPKIAKEFTPRALENFEDGMETTASIFGRNFEGVPEENIVGASKYSPPGWKGQKQAGTYTIFGSERANSDPVFGFTDDISTLCPRQDQYVAVMAAIEHQADLILDPNQRYLIGRMMEDAGVDPACFFCYGQAGRDGWDQMSVRAAGFTRRMAEAAQAGPLDDAAMMQALGWKKNAKGQWKDGVNPEGPLQQFLKTNAAELSARENLFNPIAVRDLAEGRVQPKDAFEAEYVKNLLVYVNGSKRNSQKPFATYTDWYLTPDARLLADHFNKNVGWRLNSQTDWRPWHIIEMAQKAAHWTLVKDKAHAYTKEEAFVDIFGGTGLKFNMSLAYAHKNGKLVRDARGRPTFNARRSINPARVEEFLKKYPDDVGGMLVAMNDEAFAAGLDDPRVGMIIPFHRSGVRKGVTDAEFARDYTRFQEEKWPKRAVTNADGSVSKELIGKGEVVTVRLSNGKSVSLVPGQRITGEHHFNEKHLYLELLTKVGKKLGAPISPRFGGLKLKVGGKVTNVIDHPNYMKLVRDVAANPQTQRHVDARKINWAAAQKYLRAWQAEGGDEARNIADPELVENILGRLRSKDLPAGVKFGELGSDKLEAVLAREQQRAVASLERKELVAEAGGRVSLKQGPKGPLHVAGEGDAPARPGARRPSHATWDDLEAGRVDLESLTDDEILGHLAWNDHNGEWDALRSGPHAEVELEKELKALAKDAGLREVTIEDLDDLASPGEYSDYVARKARALLDGPVREVEYYRDITGGSPPSRSELLETLRQQIEDNRPIPGAAIEKGKITYQGGGEKTPPRSGHLKRLKQGDRGSYLYHVTPRENAGAIAREGLRPDAPKIAEGGPHANTKAVFLTDEAGVETYRDLYGGDVEVFRVPRARVKGLEDDVHSEGNAWLTREPIPADALERAPKVTDRGSIDFTPPTTSDAVTELSIAVNKGSDPSTLAHETFHGLSVIMHQAATSPKATPKLKQAYQNLLDVMGYASPADRWKGTAEEIMQREETASRLWEQFLASGEAPNAPLAGAFKRFQGWLAEIQTGLDDPQAKKAFGEMLGAKAKGPAQLAPRAAALAVGTDAVRQEEKPGYSQGGTVMPFKVVREDTDHFVAEGNGGSFKIAKKALSPATTEKYRGYCKGGEVKPQKMAKGGEVPYRLLREDENEFEVEQSGSRFRVAKKALSSATVEKIRGYASGGTVEDEDENDFPLTAVYAQAVPADATMRDIYARDAAIHPPPPAEDPIDFESLAPAGPIAPQPVSMEPEATPVVPREGTQAPVPTRAELAAMVPSPFSATTADWSRAPRAEQAKTVFGEQPAEAPAAPPAAPAAYTPPPMPALPQIQVSGPGKALSQIDEGVRQQQEALKQQAEVARQEAAEVLQAQEEAQVRREQFTKEWSQKRADWQANGDALRQNILDSKIDANRLWSNASTGQKLSAVIGLIVGGIGSGLTRQPNAALMVIDNAIARDIDAQKAELGKKETLYSFHLQAGHEMKAAEQLARADMLDAAAAKIQMAATRFVGDKAQAAAIAEAGKLTVAAGLARDQVQTNAVQRANAELDIATKRVLLPYQIASAARQMEMERIQHDRMLQILQNPGAFPEADVLRAKGVKEGAIVERPDGRAYQAKTEAAGDKVRETMLFVDQGRAGIRDLEFLMNKPTSSWDLQDRARARTVQQSLVGLLRLPITGPGAMNEGERKMLEGMIANPTAIFSLDPTNLARLQQLKKVLENAELATLSNYTVGGGAIGPRTTTRME